MSERIGTKQRPIIDALKAGGVLLNEYGTWSLREKSGPWYTVNRERCMGLYVRGFIMADGVDEARVIRVRYVLTEKGKRA
jgi:hypothetical protein